LLEKIEKEQEYASLMRKGVTAQDEAKAKENLTK
jgi:hypothetical protein